MPKGIPKRADELTPIEGGAGGSGSTGIMKELAGGAAILGGMYGVGLADRAATKEADKVRKMNSREQYEHEREAGDPNALQMTYEEWKKL